MYFRPHPYVGEDFGPKVADAPYEALKVEVAAPFSAPLGNPGTVDSLEVEGSRRRVLASFSAWGDSRGISQAAGTLETYTPEGIRRGMQVAPTLPLQATYSLTHVPCHGTLLGTTGQRVLVGRRTYSL